jgi:hypothetical protein
MYVNAPLLNILRHGSLPQHPPQPPFSTTILNHVSLFFRIIGVVPEMSQETKDNSEGIKALRAIRVLRPLKLVSGIPSKFIKCL